MATTRFNAFVFKALSNTAIHTGYAQPTMLVTRSFARTAGSSNKTKSKTKTKSKSTKAAKPKEVKPKRVTKKDEKLQKLMKQYPDPQQPKRPLNAYVRFSADYRKRNNPDISRDTLGNVAKSIAAAWRRLPDAEKSKYTQSYAIDKNKYKEAKKKYDESDRPQLWLDKIMKLSQEKPPKSGYQLFMKRRLPQNKEREPMTPIPQIMSMTASEWSSLPADKKQQWADKAKGQYAEWERKLK